MQVGSWCCGEYGDQLFVDIEEDESLNVSSDTKICFVKRPVERNVTSHHYWILKNDPLHNLIKKLLVSMRIFLHKKSKQWYYLLRRPPETIVSSTLSCIGFIRLLLDNYFLTIILQKMQKSKSFWQNMQIKHCFLSNRKWHTIKWLQLLNLAVKWFISCAVIGR